MIDRDNPKALTLVLEPFRKLGAERRGMGGLQTDSCMNWAVVFPDGRRSYFRRLEDILHLARTCEEPIRLQYQDGRLL